MATKPTETVNSATGNTTIECNRGDRLTLKIVIDTTFNENDKLKFSIVEKKNYNKVLFQRTYTILEETDEFYITLSEDDTRFSDVISKPVTYWYEIEYNDGQTLIGYDENGAKEFILYPEAPVKE